MKRRNFLTAALGIPAGIAHNIPADANAHKGKKSFRIAHITDIHVKTGSIPEQGMAKALQVVQSLKEKADFIVNTGDAIMDALATDKPAAKTQWDLYQTILKKENQLPVYSCIGNHDVWGWFNKIEADKLDKVYGKQWAVDELQMPRRYYRIDRSNWTLIFLDSTQLNPAGGYIAFLDAEQLEWLKGELQNAQDHVCIFSHIPILSICAGLFFNKTQENGDLVIQRNLMHTDFFKLRDIFFESGKIRACISGHIHLQDDITFNGTRYLCNGAISGNWWKGSFQGFAPAFATLDFFADGSIQRTMIDY